MHNIRWVSRSGRCGKRDGAKTHESLKMHLGDLEQSQAFARGRLLRWGVRRGKYTWPPEGQTIQAASLGFLVCLDLRKKCPIVVKLALSMSTLDKTRLQASASPGELLCTLMTGWL